MDFPSLCTYTFYSNTKLNHTGTVRVDVQQLDLIWKRQNSHLSCEWQHCSISYLKMTFRTAITYSTAKYGQKLEDVIAEVL